MKYVRRISFNPITGAIERLVAEGETSGRPWAILDVWRDAESSSAAGTDGSVPYSVCQGFICVSGIFRLYCTDFGVGPLASMLVSDWKKLYIDLSEMKSPDGEKYETRWGISAAPLWTESPKQDFYLEFDLARANPQKYAFSGIAEGFLEAAAPFLLKMAAVGKNCFIKEV